MISQKLEDKEERHSNWAVFLEGEEVNPGEILIGPGYSSGPKYERNQIKIISTEDNPAQRPRIEETSRGDYIVEVGQEFLPEERGQRKASRRHPSELMSGQKVYFFNWI